MKNIQSRSNPIGVAFEESFFFGGGIVTKVGASMISDTKLWQNIASSCETR